MTLHQAKPLYRQDAAVVLKSETHGGEDVPIYASGPMSYLFTGTVEQSFIAHAMAYSACIGPYNNTNCRNKRGIYHNFKSSASINSFNYLFFITSFIGFILFNL